VRVIGDDKVEAIEVMKTRLDAEGRAVDTGETETIPWGSSSPASATARRIEGAPFDESAGRFISTDGLIAPGLWCVGWARRGPTGTIGTNRQDGFSLVEKLAATRHPAARPGAKGSTACWPSAAGEDRLSPTGSASTPPKSHEPARRAPRKDRVHRGNAIRHRRMTNEPSSEDDKWRSRHRRVRNRA
jgi:hypothetical protein